MSDNLRYLQAMAEQPAAVAWFRGLFGVAHVEVDAESHLDAVRALKIWRTPTTFIIDTAGRIVGRAQGIPNRDQVLAAVTPLLPSHSPAMQGQPS